MWAEPVHRVNVQALDQSPKSVVPVTSVSTQLTASELDSIRTDLETKLFPRVGVVNTLRYISRKPRSWITIVFILVSAALATWRSVLQDSRELEESRRQFASSAEDVAYTLTRQLSTSASSVYTLASMVEADGGVWLRSNFKAVASTILTRYRGISNMDIAPYAVVETKVPLAGNEGAIGHAMLSDARRINATLATIRARAFLLDGPLLLIQGGTAVIGRYPVFSNYSQPTIPDIRSWWPSWNHTCCKSSLPLPGYGAEVLPGGVDQGGRQTYFWGLIEFVSFLDKLMEDLELGQVAETMTFQFRNRNKHPSMRSDVFMNSPDAPPDRVLPDPVVIAISPNGLGIEWEFVAVPKGGWRTTSSLFIVCMLSIYGGLFISLITIFLMESKSLQIYSAKQLVSARAKLFRDALTRVPGPPFHVEDVDVS